MQKIEWTYEGSPYSFSPNRRDDVMWEYTYGITWILRTWRSREFNIFESWMVQMMSVSKRYVLISLSCSHLIYMEERNNYLHKVFQSLNNFIIFSWYNKKMKYTKKNIKKGHKEIKLFKFHYKTILFTSNSCDFKKY